MKTEIVVEGRVRLVAREAVSVPPACSSMLQRGVQLSVSATQADSTLITGGGGRAGYGE
jgi:hypothetical protein